MSAEEERFLITVFQQVGGLIKTALKSHVQDLRKTRGTIPFKQLPAVGNTGEGYTPAAHAADHEADGGDEIALGNLAGQLVAGQIPDGLIDEDMLAFDPATQAELDTYITAAAAALSAHAATIASGAALGHVRIGTGLAIDPGTGILSTTGTAPTGSAGGDLTGTYPNPTIGADKVTYAQMQNVSTTDRLLGRVSASGGDIEEIPISDFVQSILDDADAAAVRATIGAIGGSGTAGYVAYYSGTAAITGDANYTWDTTNHTLDVSGGAAATTTRIRIGYVTSGDYTDFFHASADRIAIDHYVASGPANLDFNPRPADGTSAANFRFGRLTTTTDGITVTYFLGDGSATIQSQFRGIGNSYVVGNNGNFGVRATTFGASSVGVFGIKAGTPATSSITDGILMWAEDINATAGKTGLMLRTEDGTRFVFGHLAGYGTSAPVAVHHFTSPTLGGEIARWETTATNDDVRESVYQNRVATTNATITTLHTHAIPASTTLWMEARVTARRTGGSAGTAEDGAAYTVRAAFKNVAGVATMIGAVDPAFTREDQAGWDATIDVDGAGNARVRVTGATNNNITWHATIRTWQVGT